MTGRNLRLLPLAATLLLAACGGGTAATTGPGGATAGPVATAGPGGQPTTAPIATVAGGPGGGGFTGGPCTLLTAGEIEAATGVTNAVGTETPMQNGSGGCGWVGGDDKATLGAAISVTTGDNARIVFETWTSQAGSEALPGIGDGAVFASGTILFLKGSTLIGMSAGPFFAEADVRKASGIEMAKVIAGKL